MPLTQSTGWVGWRDVIPICWSSGRSGFDQRLDHKSRMRREPPVRIREGLGVKLPRATRLVIGCRGTASEAMTAMRAMMSRLKPTVNETKTRRCQAPGEPFDFLGYTIGLCHSPRTGKSYIGTRPSAKKVQRLCRAISEQTSRRWGLLSVEEVVSRLNRQLDGWANYFRLGPVSKAYRAVDSHARRRLRRWLCRKHQVKGRGTSRYPDTYLHQTLGLTRLEGRKRSFA